MTDFPEFAERRCAKCPCIEDLTPLGHLDLCRMHFREAIKDLDLGVGEIQNTPDESDHSGLWKV